MLDLIAELESIQPHAVHAAVNARLSDRFPGRFTMATKDGNFTVGPWATQAAVTVTYPTPAPLVRRVFGSKGDVSWTVFAGHQRFEWQGAPYDVLTLQIPDGMHMERWAWVTGPSQERCFALFGEVVDYNSRTHGEVLVFSAGCFSKDEDLQAAIEATRFEDLVLPEGLGAALQADLTQFLGSQALYAEAGAVWKRGLLLLGPPGNGKTHAIKALLHQAKLPCIYVKSFVGRYAQPSETIPQAFERARSIAPCAVVLEDLDSLVDSNNRSFLLNELDGFEANHGLVVIASTNHPERLDPSLLHRPSRFDRKYRFELPDAALRLRYLERWAAKLPVPVAAEVLAQAQQLTEGFTFAYLKEVGLSTLMQWASEARRRPPAEVLLGVIAGLREEILASPGEPPAPPRPDGSMQAMAAMMARYR